MIREDPLCYELASDESLSEGVITAVAEASESDPTDLPPLYKVIDPDALDSLFTAVQKKKPTGDGRVRFPYDEFEVVVHSYRVIRVQSLTEDPPRDEQEAVSD